MNPELVERLRKQISINKTGKIVDPVQAARAQEPEGFIQVDLGAKLQDAFEAKDKYSLETIPRETVLKMFIQRKLDEYFIFPVALGEGHNYVQAMRQVLSRTRKRALRKKQRLDEFRLLTVSIEHKDHFDEITLVRTKTMSEHEESVYDELLDAFTKKDK